MSELISKFQQFEQDLISLLDLYDLRLDYDESSEDSTLYVIGIDSEGFQMCYDLNIEAVLWNNEWANK